MITSVGSFATFIYGLVKLSVYGHDLWIIGLLTYLSHPIVFELLLNLKATLNRSSIDRMKFDYLRNKFPIVYSSGYNITACGLEKMHPFDSTKY